MLIMLGNISLKDGVLLLTCITSRSVSSTLQDKHKQYVYQTPVHFAPSVFANTKRVKKSPYICIHGLHTLCLSNYGNIQQNLHSKPEPKLYVYIPNPHTCT